MTSNTNTIRVFIPLTFRRKNGRPKILPPAHIQPAGARMQDPHVLRAIARAWNWRRKLERGEVSTIHDIAMAEKVTDQHVGRMMRLAYLSPDVLERLVIHRQPPALSLNDLMAVPDLPWAEQMERVFNSSRVNSSSKEPGRSASASWNPDDCPQAGSFGR